MDRILNDEKLVERCFRGKRDQKRQLREKQHPAGDHTPTHTRTVHT